MQKQLLHTNTTILQLFAYFYNIEQISQVKDMLMRRVIQGTQLLSFRSSQCVVIVEQSIRSQQINPQIQICLNIIYKEISNTGLNENLILLFFTTTIFSIDLMNIQNSNHSFTFTSCKPKCLPNGMNKSPAKNRIVVGFLTELASTNSRLKLYTHNYP